MIAGGKYTTYRVMAKDAVDAALIIGAAAPQCVTEQVPLLGAEGFTALWNARQRLAEDSGLHVARIEHLLHRYGTLVTSCSSWSPRPLLGRPLDGRPTTSR